MPALHELREAVADTTAFTDAVREATNAFNVGDYDRAVALFATTVDTHPNYADLHARLGLARMEADDAAGAVESLQRALAINPDYAEARYYLGVALFRAGRYAEADALRARIAAAGYAVRDTPAGAHVERLAPAQEFPPISRAADVPDLRAEPDTYEFSVNLLARDSRADLERCVRSVLRHSAGHSLELLIVDNGSTDDTEMIVRGYAARFGRRIKLVAAGEIRGSYAAATKGSRPPQAKFLPSPIPIAFPSPPGSRPV